MVEESMLVKFLLVPFVSTDLIPTIGYSCIFEHKFYFYSNQRPCFTATALAATAAAVYSVPAAKDLVSAERDNASV